MKTERYERMSANSKAAYQLGRLDVIDHLLEVGATGGLASICEALKKINIEACTELTSLMPDLPLK